MNWLHNLNASTEKINYEAFLKEKFNQVIFLTIVTCLVCTFFLYIFNIKLLSLYLSIGLFALAHIFSLYANFKNNYNLSLWLNFLPPVFFFPFLSFTFPFLNLEGVFSLLTAIAGLVFIINDKWKKIVFYFYAALTLFLQSYESFFTIHEAPSANHNIINIILIFAFLIHCISLLMLMQQTYGFHLSQEKKQRDDQLMEGLNFMESLINTIEFPIFFKGTDGVYIGCNQAFADLHQISREKVTGMTIEDFTYNDFTQTYKDTDQVLLKKKSKVIYETKTMLPDKKILDIIVYKSLFYNKQKEIAGILGIFLDVTERNKDKKIIETQLQELDKMNSALVESNQKLENFAFEASHDLKAPIRTINSFAELLNRKARPKLNKDEMEYVDFIISASRNLDEMVNNLLHYSRLNTKPLNITPVNIKNTIEIILLELDTLIKDKNPEIIFQSLPEIIHADKLFMRLIFQNLISNAIKYGPVEKRPKIEIEGWETANNWVFQVKDNGIGIPIEQQKNIFDLFHKLHAQHEYEGNGIGLAICNKIAKLHNGHFELESKVHQGSTFRFYIDKSLSQPKASPIPNEKGV